MKIINKEIFRTQCLEEAKNYKCKDYFYEEKQLVSYTKKEVENKNLEILQYLKDKNIEKNLKILQDFFKTNKTDKNYYRLKLDRNLVKTNNLKKLTIPEKEELVNRGYVTKIKRKIYIGYIRKENPLNIAAIKPIPETYQQYIKRIVTLIEGSGYKEINLPLSVSYQENFSFLNLNNDNIVSENDNYYLEELKDKKTRLLKPHCTGIMLKKVKEDYLKKENNNYYCISKVYRKETQDRSHSCTFTQLEVTHIFNKGKIRDSINKFFVKLKEILGIVLPGLTIENYYTYYPYTTPSVEFYNPDISLELGGGGIFNFKLIEKKEALGFALGLERCYMYLNHIEKISEIK